MFLIGIYLLAACVPNNTERVQIVQTAENFYFNKDNWKVVPQSCSQSMVHLKEVIKNDASANFYEGSGTLLTSISMTDGKNTVYVHQVLTADHAIVNADETYLSVGFYQAEDISVYQVTHQTLVDKNNVPLDVAVLTVGSNKPLTNQNEGQ